MGLGMRRYVPAAASGWVSQTQVCRPQLIHHRIQMASNTRHLCYLMAQPKTKSQPSPMVLPGFLFHGRPEECTPKHLSPPTCRAPLCPAFVDEPPFHHIVLVVVSDMPGAPRGQLFSTSKSSCWVFQAFGKGFQAGPANGNYRST